MRQNVTPSPHPARPDESILVAFPRLVAAVLLCAGLLLPACASQEKTAAPNEDGTASEATAQASEQEDREAEERESDVIVIRPWKAPDSLRTFSFESSDGDTSRVFTFRYDYDDPDDSMRAHFDSLMRDLDRSQPYLDSLLRSMPDLDSLRFSMRRQMDSLRVFRMDSLQVFRFEDDGFDRRFRFWSDRNQALADSMRDSAERLMNEFNADRSERLRERAERLREQAERLEEEAERLEREDAGDDSNQ